MRCDAYALQTATVETLPGVTALAEHTRPHPCLGHTTYHIGMSTHAHHQRRLQLHVRGVLLTGKVELGDDLDRNPGFDRQTTRTHHSGNGNHPPHGHGHANMHSHCHNSRGRKEVQTASGARMRPHQRRARCRARQWWGVALHHSPRLHCATAHAQALPPTAKPRQFTCRRHSTRRPPKPRCSSGDSTPTTDSTVHTEGEGKTPKNGAGSRQRRKAPQQQPQRMLPSSHRNSSPVSVLTPRAT